MPGIAGVIALDHEANLLSNLTAMVERISDDGQGRPHEATAVAGGAVAHSTFSNGLDRPHVARSEDGRVLAVVDGRLFDCALIRGNFPQRPRTAAAAVLALYLSMGDRFVDQLKGTFRLAIWDSRRRVAILAVDGFGLRPLYYRRIGRFLAFASRVSALEACGAPPAPVDEAGVAEFLVFGMPIGTRTLLEDVQLVPPGTMVTARVDGKGTRRFWRPSYQPMNGTRFSRADWGERAAEVFLKALKEIARATSVIDVPLSGGLDSRLIVAALHRLEVPVRAFTIGSPDAPDLRIAARVARRLAVPHTAWELKPEDSITWARDGGLVNDGMFPAFDSHALWIARHLPPDSQLVLDGVNPMDGYFYRYHIPTVRIAPHQFKPINLVRRICTGPLFDERGELTAAGLFSERFASIARERLEAGIEELAESLPPPMQDPYGALDYLEVVQRIRRFSGLGARFFRTRCEALQPFFHPAVFELTAMLPGRLRGAEKPVLAEMLHRIAPELSHIPYERTGLPPRARRSRLWFSMTKRVIRRAAARLSLGGRGTAPGSAIDYGGWLTSSDALKAFVRETLLDARARERGYLEPSALERLVEDQLAGRTRQLPLIGRLLSLELWHREIFEGRRRRPAIPPIPAAALTPA